MRFDLSSTAWWGAPRKFDTHMEERRVSWLELFYDLVYVIAISRITHHFAHHISLHSFFEFTSLFVLIFWGWLNGSQYHDLHGSEGLRTRLMTLWQMMIIAALAITTGQSEEYGLTYTIIVLMIMQVFITYLWWSVGIYDKEHRRYNMPYTVLYLLGFALMALGLWLDHSWLPVLVPAIVICNYLPPFIAHRLLSRSSLSLDMSPSMFERLGLFTIIVFGELVLGVVNGIGGIEHIGLFAWLNFCLALAVVFALWWIFFTLISNREVKKGFFNASVLQMLFIPTLVALGLMAACLSSLFEVHHGVEVLQSIFGYAVAVFLTGINLMMGLIEYSPVVHKIRKSVRGSLSVAAGVFFVFALQGIHLESMYYLIVVIVLLSLEIIFLNSLYYRENSRAQQ